MPFVTTSPGVNLFYESYLTLSPAPRPWLLLIHPLFDELTSLSPFVSSKEVRSAFNIIMFDARYHGRSEAPPCVATDLYTTAADFVFAMDKLQISRAHVLASHPWSGEVALRMAWLWPQKVVSLAIVGLGPDVDSDFHRNAFKECFDNWINPSVPEDWDEAIAETAWFHFGVDVDADVLDRYAIMFVRRYPPSKAVSAYGSGAPYIGRPAMPAEATAIIRERPILVLHGEIESCYKVTEARARFERIVSGGHPQSTFNVIPEAPLNAVWTNGPLVVSMFLDWFDTLTADTPIDKPDISACNREALERLARGVGDDEISARNPEDAASYNVFSATEKATVQATLEVLSVYQTTAFSLIGGGPTTTKKKGVDGENCVPWHFSKRFDDARLASRAHFSGPDSFMITSSTVDSDGSLDVDGSV